MEGENSTVVKAPEIAEGNEATADTDKVTDKEESTAAEPPTPKPAAPTSTSDDAVDDKHTDETNGEKATASEAIDENIEETSDPMEEETTKEKPAAAEAEEKTVEPVLTRGGRRVRKPISSYDELAKQQPKTKEIVIPDGNGEKLMDIPNVVKNFKDVTWSDPHLKMLHTIVFGVGKKKEFKARLFEFSGLVYSEGKKEEEEQEKIKEKMYKLTMPELKAVMDLVDIDRSRESFDSSEKGTPGKEVHCERFLEWLEKPKASGKKVTTSSSKKSPAAKKRKSTDSAKGSAKKTTPAKKAKKTPDKKKTSAKKAKKTPPAKKAAAKKSPSKAKKAASDEVVLDIPGVDIEKVKAKVKGIVDNANREELTVKGVRKILEDWLDTDLSEHKDAIRSIVMEVM
mmetsp:Transcript_12007/g.29342  ORF Transcript_12007/g.29342 Transcript_12007/m.29342 type:complete len:398 (+) Transcript_12007:159-1352(+)